MRQRSLLVGVLLIALVGTALFAGRAVIHAFDLRDAPRAEEKIAPWMSIRMAARRNNVPPHVVGEAIGVPPPEPGFRPGSLEQIAEQRGVAFEVVESEIEAAVAAWRADRD